MQPSISLYIPLYHPKNRILMLVHVLGMDNVSNTIPPLVPLNCLSSAYPAPPILPEVIIASGLPTWPTPEG